MQSVDTGSMRNLRITDNTLSEDGAEMPRYTASDGGWRSKVVSG